MRNLWLTLTHELRGFGSAALALAAVLAGAGPAVAQAPSAIAVWGQSSFTTNTQVLPPTASSLFEPIASVVDNSGNLYIVDRGNSRVLMYAPGSTTATKVWGQTNFTTGYNGACPAATATNLCTPNGIFIDGNGNLWVADNYSRVLMFPPGSTTPSLVLGQSSFTSSTCAVSAIGMCGPSGIVLIGTTLFVSDGSNNRVLVFYNAAGLSNGAAANVVIGQPNFVTNTSGISSTKLNSPGGLDTDGNGNLYVADGFNNRVLIYGNALALANGAAATTVIGQPDFISNSSGTSATQFNLPSDAKVDSQGNLYVCDVNNDRVLYFANAATSGNGQTATKVWGQSNFTGGAPQNGQGLGHPNAQGFYTPLRIYLDNYDNLYVGDYTNNRVLQFGKLAPGITWATPSAITYGTALSGTQLNATANYNGTAVAGTFVYSPASGSVLSAGTQTLSVTFTPTDTTTYDTVTSTVSLTVNKAALTIVASSTGLFAGSPVPTITASYSGFVNGETSASLTTQPTCTTTYTTSSAAGSAQTTSCSGAAGANYTITYVNGTVQVLSTSQPPLSATLVWGQTGFTTKTSGVSATTQFNPEKVAVDSSGNLYEVDSSNHRVLMYAPGSSTATRVYGQGGSFTTRVTGNDANSLNTPGGIALDSSGNVWVADTANSRVVMYPPGSTTASLVLGQSGFGTSTASTSSTGLNNPQGIGSDGTNLYVADVVNNRVLIYKNAASLSNGAAASVVLGQTDFVSSSAGLSSTKFAAPIAVNLDNSGNLYVADYSNNRVLIFHNAASLSNDAAASTVIGQSSFTSNSSGTASNQLHQPRSAAVDNNGNLYVADFANSRVLYYPNAAAGGNGPSAQTVYGQNGFGQNSANQGGSPSATTLNFPAGLAFDSQGNLYVADEANNRVLAYGTFVPQLTWNSPNPISYSTPLSTTQLNATANMSGSFVYSPAAGTVLAAGTYTLSVTFTPTNTAYSTVTTSVSLSVDRVQLVITGSSTAVYAGSPVPAITPVYSGLVNGDTGASLTTQPTCTTTYTTAAAAGSTQTSSCSGAAGANYFPIFYGNGTVQVLSANEPAIAAVAVWGQAGSFTTNTAGLSATNLSGPSGTAVDSSGNLYVADTSNNRVLMFPPGSTTATRVYGQNGSFTTANFGATATSLNTPYGIALDGSGNLWVADYGNARVLMFPPGSTTASLVLGQSTFTSNTAGTTSARMWDPRSVVLIGTTLFVADSSNNRVLIYNNAAALADGAAANTVLGQSGFTSNGAGTTQTALNFPQGLVADGNGNLYVADTGNNRVLIYGSALSLSNGAAASTVIGQSNFTSRLNGSGQSQLSLPIGVVVDNSGNLYVADNSCNRLLYYPNAAASGNGQPAKTVYGQIGFLLSSANQGGSPGATTLSGPFFLALDSHGNLYVGDSNNNRVLQYGKLVPQITWNTPSAITYGTALSGTQLNATAAFSGTTVPGTFAYSSASGTVLSAGTQTLSVTFTPTDTTTYTSNTATVSLTVNPVALSVTASSTGVTAGAAVPAISASFSGFVNGDTSASLTTQPTCTTTYTASSAAGSAQTSSCSGAVDPNYTFTYHTGTVQVLSAGQPGIAAVAVWGQGGSFTSAGSGTTSTSMKNPAGVVVDSSGNVYVAEYSNNRVLMYPPGSTTATRVYGQPNFTTSGAGLSAAGLNGPAELAIDGSGNLWVTDTNNSRVLMYAPGSTTATKVLGQPSFTANGTAATSTGMNFPYSVAFIGTTLFVADLGNNRVLMFNNAAGLANGAAANVVLGQTSFTGLSSGLSSTKFNQPAGVAGDANGNLYVADYQNNRVLIFHNAVSLSSGAAANIVLGQAFFTTAASGASANQLSQPGAVAPDSSGNLYVADTANNRVLYYPNPAAGANGPSAQTVYGQIAFVLNSPNQGGSPSATGLNQPFALTLDSRGNLYVADYSNNRALAYGKIVPAITWNNPAAINYGTALSATQLNATANVPGTFAYNPPAGTVPAGGTQTLSVTFTPTDTTTYDTATASVSLTVNKAPLTITALSTGVYTQGPVPTITASYSGFVNGDTSASLTTQPACTTTFTVGAAPGSAQTSSCSGAVSPSYTFTYQNGTVQVLSANEPALAAILVWGQPDFTTASSGTTATNLFAPGATAVDSSGNLYVADSLNHRVLMYPLGSTTATQVYGQNGSFTTHNAGSGATGLNNPIGLALDGSGNLWVADHGNNRVLMFPPGSTTATRVLGQPSFTAVSSGTTATGLFGPNSLAFIGANLFVADVSNNRVVMYSNAATLPNGSAATLVLGQSNFTTATAGLSASRMNGPVAVATDSSGNLYVADDNNARVLVFGNATTLSNGAAASTVIGQASFTTNATGSAANQLNAPNGLAVDNSGNLFVADFANNRVLYFPNAAASGNGPSAKTVYGQTAFGLHAANQGGSPSATTLSQPDGISIDSHGNLYVADRGNNRVLQYGKFIPQITWSTPAAIPYGTALSATQLNATANVPGTFAYSPAAGTVLSPGTQTLSVTFTPTDLTTYTTNTASVSLTVNQAGSTTILIITPPQGGAIYGSNIGLAATVSGSGGTPTGTVQFQYSVDNGTTWNNLGSPVTLSGGAAALQIAAPAVGSPSLRASYSGDSNFATSNSAGTPLSVAPAALTVTGLTAQNKPYDGSVSAAITGTPALSGIIGADNVTLSGTPAGSFATAVVGNSKTVTVVGLSLSGTAVSNYTLTQPSLTANITAVIVTVTASSATVTYGGAAPIITAGYGGFVNGETNSVLTTQPTCTTTYTPTTPVASSPVATSCFGAAAANYTFTYANGAVTIQRASLSVTASSTSVPYGSAAPSITAAITGFVNNENSSVLTAQPVCTTSYAPGASANSAQTSSCSGATAANYTFAYHGGTITVQQKSLAPTLAAVNKFYDGTTAATVTCSLIGLYGNDQVTCAAAATFASAGPGNNIQVNVTSITLAGGQAGNYTLAATTATLSANIMSTTPTVTTLPSSGTYGATATLTATVQAQGDGPTPTGSITFQFTANSTTYFVCQSGAVQTTACSIPLVNGTATVASAGLPTGSDTVQAIYSGDSVYATGQTNITVSVSQATTNTALSVTPPAGGAIYGGSVMLAATVSDNSTGSTGTPTGTVQFQFSTNGNTWNNLGSAVALTNGTTSLQASGLPAGSPTVRASYSGDSNFLAGNSGSTPVIVAPASVTVTGVTAANKVYDGTTAATVSTAGATLAGVVSGDAVGLAGTPTGTFTDANAGTGKTVTISGLSLTGTSASNYTLVQPTTTANITQAPVTVTASSATVNYGDSVPTITPGFSGFAGSDSSSVLTAQPVCTTSYMVTTPVAAPTPATTCSGATAVNYSFSYVAGAVTIHPAPLTITATTNTKTYDGTTSAASVPTISGLRNTDTVTGLAEVYADKNVGSSKTLSVSAYTVNDGANGGNYAVSKIAGNGAINAAPLTITAAANTKTYDSTVTASAAPAFTGLMPGDNATATESYDTKIVGTGKTLSVATYTITDGNSGNNYTVTKTASTAGVIATAPVTPGATANSKVYDGTTTATATVSLNGVFAGDSVSASGLASFSDPNVGAGKTVTVTGITLSSTDAANYALTTTTATATAGITARTATVSVTGINKVYDGTIAAAVSCAVTGTLAGDTVTCSAASASFQMAAAGNNIPVTANGITLGGAAGGDYSPSATTATTTANITPAPTTLPGPSTGTSTYGVSTTLSVTIPAISGGATPTGSVTFQFTVNSTTYYVCTGGATGTMPCSIPLSGGAASVQTSALPVGADAVQAVYSGDSNYSGGQTSITVTVSQAGTQTALTVTPPAGGAVYGAAVALSATVSDPQNGSLTPTGSVQFQYNNGTNWINLGSPVTLTNGAASLLTTALPAGSPSLRASYSGDANFLGGYSGGTPVTVAPATLTVSGVTAQNKVYDGNTTATVSTSGAALVGVIPGDTVHLTGIATGSFPDANAGAGKTVTVAGLSLNGSSAANYTLTQPTATANIAQATVTITASNATVTYGGAAPAITPGFSGFVGSDTSSVLSTQPTCTTTYAPGSPVATSSPMTSCSGAAALNYNFVYVPGTVTVHPVPLTITASNATATYGGTAPAITASYSGFVNNENSSVVSPLPACTSSFTTASPVSSSPVSSCSGAAAANYSITYVNGSVTVQAKGITASVTGTAKNYDGTPSAVVACSPNGIINGDQVTCSAASAAFVSAGVGTGIAVNASGITLGGPGAANYSLSPTTAATTASINPATLTATASSAAVTYGDAAPSITAVFSGFANNENGSVVTTAPVCSTSYTVGSAAGSLQSTSCSGAAAANYTFSYVNGKVTVAAKSVTPSITALNKSYDGTLAATASCSLAGVVLNDLVSCTAGSATFASAAPGSNIVVTATGIALNGAKAANYSLSATTGATTANITAASTTLPGPSTGSSSYGVSTTLSLTIPGIPNGATPTGSVTFQYTVGSVTYYVCSGGAIGTTRCSIPLAGGTASVTTSGLPVGADAVQAVYSGDSDYTGGQTSITVTVSQAGTQTALTVTPPAGGAVYGGSVTLAAAVSDPQNSSLIPTGSVQFQYSTDNGITWKNLGGVVSLNISGAASLQTSALPAGNVLLHAMYSGDTNFGGGSSGNTPISVAPASLTVTGVTAANKVYDGTTTASVSLAGAALSGVIPGDNVSLVGTPTGTFSNANAGAGKTVTVGGLSLSGSPASNYTLTQPTATANITQATVTITASSATVTYGGAVPSITPAFTGFIGSDSSTVLSTQPSCTTSYTTSAPVTTSSPMTSCSGAAAVNYTFAYVPGTVTVRPAPLTITASSATVHYGDSVPSIIPAYSGFVNNENSSVLSPVPACTTAYTTASPVGTSPATSCAGAGAADYAIQYVSGAVTIQQKAVSASVTSTGKTYDGTTSATVSCSLTGVINGDLVTCAARSAAFVSASAATGVTVNASGITLGGTGAANYTLSSTTASTSATIKQAPLTVTAASVSRPYYQANPPLTGTIAGVQNGDGITAAYTTTATVTSPAGPYPITPAIVDPNNRLTNYTVSLTGGILTVTPAAVLTLTPTALAFGGQNVMTAATLNLTIQNTGAAAISTPAAAISGANAGDFTLTNNCPASVTSNGACTVAVTFTPKAAGARTAVLTLIVPGAVAQTVNLSGTGILTYAMYAAGKSCGALSLSGSALVDSYDSSAGTYAATKSAGGANVAVAGSAILSGKAAIDGILYLTNPTAGNCDSKNPAGGYQLSGQAQVTGGYQPLTALTWITPGPFTAGTTDVNAKSSTSLQPGAYRDVTVDGKSTILTLAPGTYTMNSLTLTGQSQLVVSPSGPVVINIAGTSGNQPLDLSGGSVADSAGKPANLMIVYGGTAQINVTGQADSYGVLYAPNAPVNLSGQGDWFGALIAGAVNDSGQSAVHYDRSLGH
jgi:sugar lactone lactonase YvrE